MNLKLHGTMRLNDKVLAAAWPFVCALSSHELDAGVTGQGEPPALAGG